MANPFHPPPHPSGYPPQQPAAYPPQPAPGNNKTLANVLIVVGVLLGLCCAGGATRVFFTVRDADNATREVSEAADGYLRDLLDGRYREAYARLCSQRQVEVGENGFAVAQSGQQMTSYSIVGRQVQDRHGVSTGSVQVAIIGMDGKMISDDLVLVREDGEWRVCS
ncbi:Rv0361 family membrane protein [Melissospora conviva]|uniref:Rv0361 family membrane protein n=1 Tax=Melissospora conviva TaxID=3388432 RepID=UPI003B827509